MCVVFQVLKSVFDCGAITFVFYQKSHDTKIEDVKEADGIGEETNKVDEEKNEEN